MAAWHTHAARSITRSVLSEIQHQQVAVFLEGDGDRGRPPDRGAGALCHHHRSVALSGAHSTAIVLSDGDKRFAYSGDTEWVDALVSVAAGADLLCDRMLRLFRRIARPYHLGRAQAAVAGLARVADHAHPHESDHARPSQSRWRSRG